MSEFERKSADAVSGGVPVLAYANVVLRRRRTVAAIATTVLLAVVVSKLLFGGGYMTEATLVAQSGQQSGGSAASALAAQYLGVSSSAPGTSPKFFARLATSKGLLRQVAASQYTIRDKSGREQRGTLVDLMKPEGETAEQKMRALTTQLSNDVRAAADAETGIVTVRVASSSPDLAVQINRTLIERLNQFNLARRQQRAAAERQFAETQMTDAERQLRVAEAALQGFLEANRTYQTSPQLVFRAAQLQRRVDLAQQVYVSLAQSYQQAKIDEVRNTPIVMMLQAPEETLRESGNGWPYTIAIGAALGLLVGLGYALVSAMLNRHSADHPREYEDFRRLLTLPVFRLRDVEARK